MRRLLRLFIHPVTLSALGTAALAVVLWLLGPLVQIGAMRPLDTVAERIAAVAVLAALWSLRQLFRIWRVRRANRALLDGLASEPRTSRREPQVQGEEIEQLRQHFEQALQLLKGRSARRLGRGYLYETPWYVLIGPPGSGKTTALRNSGLRFPLADQLGDPKLRGVGGTRDCDWWFTEEAVLLDTAGRYTTQDSYEQADRAAWLGFLDLLKRYRRRRPINGVLVMVSVADLLAEASPGPTAHARVIRQRIKELHERLGIRFPIYFVLTKCDLIAGFMEFFADLDREGREQVWGMTFPLEEPRPGHAPVDRFAQEFDLLVQRLEAHTLRRLQEEPDPERRALLLTFPQQFASLRTSLRELLDEAFQPSRFETPAQLRGVYFTSGTQEGSPIDRFLSSVAGTFHLDRRQLPAFSGQGQSFFITRLLREVVFAEAGLAGANLRLERQTRWLMRAGVALIALGTLALAGWWGLEYQRQRDTLDRVSETVARLENRFSNPSDVSPGLLEVLPLLDALRELAGYDAESGGFGRWAVGGLDQRPKLASAARAAYDRALHNLLLPAIQRRMVRRIRESMDDPEQLYEALRIYLMLHHPDHFDRKAVATWVHRDWRDKGLPPATTQNQRRALDRHLSAALRRIEQGGAPLPLDRDLVDRARRALASLPMADRIYRSLRSTAVLRRLAPFDPAAAAGPDAALVFHRPSGRPLNEGVPGLFTRRGFKAFSAQISTRAARLAAENWVLGAASSAPDADALRRLLQQVRERYARDYIRHWEALLQDLEIVPLRDLVQAREVLRTLSAADSPMRLLLKAVALETSPAAGLREMLSETTDAASAGSSTGLQDRLARWFGSPAAETVANPATGAIEQVDRHFERLHRLVTAPEGGRPPLDRVFDRLEELYLYVDTIASAADRGEEALRVARERARGAGVLQRIRAEADRLPQPVQRWIRGLSEGVSGVLGGQVRSRIQRAWSAEAQPFCERAIAGRYPIVRSARAEITLEDFARFFGPGGLLDRFFSDYLSPFVDTTRHPWRAKTHGSTPLSSQALRQFENADRIRKAFFPAGQREVRVHFTLTPLDLDPALRRVLLEIDGQRVEYRHGPPRSMSLTWPGPQPTRRARVVFETTALETSSETFSGPWAWFHLLDHARLATGDFPDRYRVTFEKDGHRAMFLLQAESVENPFRPDILGRFRCPARL